MEQDQELIAINQPGEIFKMPYQFEEDIQPKKYRYAKNLALTILIITALYLYQSGLTKCPYQTEIQCSKNYLLPRLPILIAKDIISILIYWIIVLLYKLKKVSGLFVCIILKILTFQLFINSHEMTQDYYKLLYQLLYGTLILFTLILTLISYAILKLFKKFGYKFLIGIILIFIFTYVYGKHQIMKSCNGWKSGLQEKQISGGTCEIVDPQYCWYDFLDGYQDFSKYYNKCQPNYYNKQSYLKKLKQFQEVANSTNYVAYPRTEKFDEAHLYLDGKQYQQYFLNQIMFLPDLQELPEDNELYLDLNSFQFQYQLPIFSMNITKNETLIQERKELANKFINKKRPKNIITIWVDAVSRPRFMKKLQKSTMKLQQISEENDRILFQGFKYTALAGFTSPNLKAYEYGYVNTTTQANSENWSKNIINETKVGKQKSLSKQLKEFGYIIGKARAQCNSQIQEFDNDQQNLFEPSFSDHEMVGISCDIMSQNINESYSITEGPYTGRGIRVFSNYFFPPGIIQINPSILSQHFSFGTKERPEKKAKKPLFYYSIFRRCINDKDQHTFVFDYAKQFLTTYEDEDKYLELYFIDGHEGTGEVINYLDESMNGFFDFLSQNNHDENSVIIFLSDHGLHMQGLSYLLGWEIFEIERSLPGMFILADKSLLNQEDQNNLYKNEQNTITIMDLRYFLKFLIGEDEQFYRNNSLISPSLQRTCKDIPMSKNDYCPCI